MLNKIVIGTANFTQPYGVFSDQKSLSAENVNSIVKLAMFSGINMFDTAFAYGDLFKIIQKNIKNNNIKIITKFSILDDYESMLNIIKNIKNQYEFTSYDAILLHDPQNLSKINQKKLNYFFDCILEQGYAKKIGISVYDIKEVKQFNAIRTPNIIQIPLNPLNQTFIDNKFLDYINENNIEVHARSLFLQGVLLSDTLPEVLVDLKPLWSQFIETVSPYKSKLQALLSWASTYNWVNKWVLGVASVENLQEIIDFSKDIKILDSLNSFINFKHTRHRLTDPRNWALT